MPSLPGTDARHHTLVVLVENKAGVLARVSGLFARRGFNIFSLAVAPTEDARLSRITIVVDVESAPLEQITKQLYKLINVVKISELDPRDSVERELMLVTVRADITARSQVIELVNLFEGRVVDVGHDELTVSLDGGRVPGGVIGPATPRAPSPSVGSVPRATSAAGARARGRRPRHGCGATPGPVPAAIRIQVRSRARRTEER